MTILYAKQAIEISPTGKVYHDLNGLNVSTIAIERGEYVFRNGYSDPLIIPETELRSFVEAFQS